MKKQYYSIEQANTILPEIKKLLKKLLDLHIKLSLQSQTSIVYEDAFKDFAQSVLESKSWYQSHYELYEILAQLAEQGIFVKDHTIGLIDFYSKHENREIFLCYKYPEEKIDHWHELDSGFANRKNISLLKQNTKI